MGMARREPGGGDGPAQARSVSATEPVEHRGERYTIVLHGRAIAPLELVAGT